eukprot:gene13500-4380_t
MATILITLFAYSIVQIAQTQRCNIDIGFILDESGSITENGFRQEKDFVKKVSGRLHVSPSNTRVSVMTFSRNPNMRIYFKDKSAQDWNALSNNLDTMTHSSGRTNTEKALQLAKTTMFNQNSGARLGVPKVLLLLTDGFSQSSTGVLSRAAYALRHDGVSIIVIAAGPLVRRAELELIASRPVEQNIFQVRDMTSLGNIVARVSTQACKPVTCFYNQCIYNEWSKWSGSCNEVTRSRTVLQQIRRSKIVMGGCAGLNTKDCVTDIDKKDIGKCLQWCKYVKCFWAGWGAWSASCGSVARQRKMIEEPAVAQRKFCQGLPQRCYQKPEIETNNLKCVSCDYVECKYTEWSKWSHSCGKDMVRKRTLQTIKKKGTDCTGKPKSCTGETVQREKKDELCECDAVKCVTQWSAWSATCGKATRTQTVVKVPIKVREESCDKVTKDCPTTTKTEIDDLICEYFYGIYAFKEQFGLFIVSKEPV